VAIRLALALFLAGCPLVLNAQSTGPNASQVIVTATRLEQPLDTALASVTVITRADIDRLQPHSVIELLEGLPGISIASNGDLGKVSSVFVRGTNSDHVLVLIDGIKVGSVTTGTTAFEQLPVEQIERIEIVRGPLSSLYGSEAIGGVIQIFTRHGTPGGPGVPSFDVSGGSHGTYQGELGYSGSAGQAWYNVSGSGLYTNGIPVCSADAPVTASCYTTSPRQGFWSASSDLSGGYRWGDHAELSLDYLRADGDTKFDGNIYSGNETRETQQVVGGRLKVTPFSVYDITLAAGQSLDQAAYNYNGTPAGFFDTRRTSASWLNEVRPSSNQELLLGLDYEHDEVASDTDYAVQSRNDTGVFGLYQWRPGELELQLSLRNDHNQQFGAHTTGAAAVGYRVSEALRFTASYGTAFKAPSFNDLYYPFYGNPDLRPETSRSFELGASGRSSLWNWGLNAYQTDVNDLIEYNPATFAPDNIDRARIRGVEGQLGVQVSHWRAQLFATWLDPRDIGVNDGNLLPRRSQGSARMDVDRDWGRASLGATFYITGPRYDDPANTERLGGYSTLDLRASLAVSRRWLLQAVLKNVFNREYQTALYYNQPGFGAYLTLRYTPSIP
jgi:vitamin B12 transporter